MNSQPMNTFRLARFPVAVLFLVLILSACTSRLTPASPSAPAVSPSATTPSGASTDRYYNAVDGFSLQIPHGWKVTGPTIATNDPIRPFDLYFLSVNPQTGTGPGTSLIAVLDPDQWDIEQFAQSQCSTCPVNPVEPFRIGEITAQRTQIGGGGVPHRITWTFFESKGKLIGLAIHDPQTLEPLEDVIQSLRLE